MGIATMDNSMEIPLKIELPYDPTIPLLEKNHNIFSFYKPKPEKSHNLKRYTQANVHCSTIHNSQNMEAILNVHQEKNG